MKQLRTCTAQVYTGNECAFIGAAVRDCELFTMRGDSLPYAHDCAALLSYSSLVAIYDATVHVMYLLPRWDYSVTTMSHVRKFAEDYANVHNMTALAIRNGDTIAIECDGYLPPNNFSPDNVRRF